MVASVLLGWYPEECRDDILFLELAREMERYRSNHMCNMDQIPLPFEITASRHTYAPANLRNVWIKTIYIMSAE